MLKGGRAAAVKLQLFAPRPPRPPGWQRCTSHRRTRSATEGRKAAMSAPVREALSSHAPASPPGSSGGNVDTFRDGLYLGARIPFRAFPPPPHDAFSGSATAGAVGISGGYRSQLLQQGTRRSRSADWMSASRRHAPSPSSPVRMRRPSTNAPQRAGASQKGVAMRAPA
jgi:hypothetical protein